MKTPEQIASELIEDNKGIVAYVNESRLSDNSVVYGVTLYDHDTDGRIDIACMCEKAALDLLTHICTTTLNVRVK